MSAAREDGNSAENNGWALTDDHPQTSETPSTGFVSKHEDKPATGDDSRPRRDNFRRDDRRDDDRRDRFRRDDRRDDDRRNYYRRDDDRRDYYRRDDDYRRDDYRRDGYRRDNFRRDGDDYRRDRSDSRRDDYRERDEYRRDDRRGRFDSGEPRKRVRNDEAPPCETIGIFGMGRDVSQTSFESFLAENIPEFDGKYSVRLIMNRTDGTCRGFGFLTFESIEDATAAKEKLDQALINGREVRAAFSIRSEPRPSRETLDRTSRSEEPLRTGEAEEAADAPAENAEAEEDQE